MLIVPTLVPPGLRTSRTPARSCPACDRPGPAGAPGGAVVQRYPYPRMKQSRNSVFNYLYSISRLHYMLILEKHKLWKFNL